jgi:hypothetical protein
MQLPAVICMHCHRTRQQLCSMHWRLAVAILPEPTTARCSCGLSMLIPFCFGYCLQEVEEPSKVSSNKCQHACDAAAAQLQQLCLEAACRKVSASISTTAAAEDATNDKVAVSPWLEQAAIPQVGSAHSWNTNCVACAAPTHMRCMLCIVENLPRYMYCMCSVQMHSLTKPAAPEPCIGAQICYILLHF